MKWVIKVAGIVKYIKKYSNCTFLEKPFNEIDNIIFSQLTYLNFEKIVPNDNMTIALNEAIKLYLENYTYKETKKEGIAQKDTYKLLNSLLNSKRYKDVHISNYIYIGNKDIQFSAMVFKYKKLFKYIAFEGTDDLISGWKENFKLVYQFPTISHKYAINYLNNTIKLFDKNVIVGGHSKGGNLALVAAMYCNPLKRLRIKKIYNIDGPGLRLKEFNSKAFSRVKDKYIHIVPNYSYIGVLLRNNEYKVIKTTRRDIMAHSPLTWVIDDNKFVETNLSKFSKNLETGVITWLDNHNDLKRKKVVNTIFQAIEDCGIDKLSSLGKLKNLMKVINSLKTIDPETKELAVDFIKFNTSYILENRKGD